MKALAMAVLLVINAHAAEICNVGKVYLTGNKKQAGKIEKRLRQLQQFEVTRERHGAEAELIVDLNTTYSPVGVRKRVPFNVVTATLTRKGVIIWKESQHLDLEHPTSLLAEKLTTAKVTACPQD